MTSDPPRCCVCSICVTSDAVPVFARWLCDKHMDEAEAVVARWAVEQRVRHMGGKDEARKLGVPVAEIPANIRRGHWYAPLSDDDAAIAVKGKRVHKATGQ